MSVVDLHGLGMSTMVDRRFRRSHVRPARRRPFWYQRGWTFVRSALLLTALGYGGTWGVQALVAAPAFRIDLITVHGNERLSTGEVMAIVGGLQGQSSLTADLDAWRRKLLESSWVADAALSRRLPRSVEIVLVERRPIGAARLGDEIHLVDGLGVLIAEHGPQYADLDLPLIDGLSVTRREDVPIVDAPRASLAARVVESVSRVPDLAARVSQIDVGNPEDAVVLLEGDAALIHLGSERLLERLQAYVQLAAALRARVPDIDSVDLRFDERIYVRAAAAGRRGQAQRRQARLRPASMR